MPPFQYQDYRNPYGPSIAEALQNQGNITAAGALQAGDLQAEAARRSGALQGQMWATVGNAVTAIPQQMQAQRELALKEQQQRQQMAIGAMTLQDKADQRAAEQQIGQLIASTPRGPNNTYDVSGIVGQLPASAIKWAEPHIKFMSDRNTEWEQQDAKRQGQLQQAAGGLLQNGAPLVGTQTLIDAAERNGTLAADRAAGYRQQLADNPDAGPRAVLGQLIGYQKPITKKADESLLNPATLETLAPAEGKPGEGEYTVGNQRFNAQHQPVGPAVVTPTADERIASLFGREQAGETLNAADKALLEGWKAKEGSKPFTVKTVVNGRPVEQVMTTADAMKQGLFTSQPTAAERTGTGQTDDVKVAVSGMKKGTLPPLLPGRASKEYVELMAEAERQGFDLAGAASDWNATQKHLATANGAQQTRLRQAVNALPDMLDKVDVLAQQWNGGPFPLLNRANLAAAKGGVYGKDAAKVASQLESQIADVVADLGNVYMGGNSPTDQALGLAQKSLSGDWDKDVLRSMVKLAKDNVQIRNNSIRNTGVAGASEGNPYDRTSGAPPPPVVVAAPTLGEKRTANGETRTWDGSGWVRVK